MMNYPLLLKNILDRNRLLFQKKEVVSRDHNGIFRYTYADFQGRVRRLANVLKNLGVEKGDRVATLAWNNHRHLELYFAVPCTGAVLHTVNLRLFPDQLVYVLNHAEDKVIFIDQDLLPIIEKIKDQIKTIRHYVIMTPEEALPQTVLAPVYSYEKLMSEASDIYEFDGDMDENTPAGMCYTTATTGNPKGVVYTHRSIFLHSMVVCMADSLGISERDVLMPVVPMFHVNAWGLPFSAAWMGTRLVLPGRHLDPKSLCQLIQDEKVTVTAGVPTIWMGIYQLLENGAGYDLSSLRSMVVGGSAAPRTLIEGFEKKYGIHILHAYGMTETSPVVLVSKLKSYMEEFDEDRRYSFRAKQGLLVPGLEMKITGPDGREVRRDGREMGELQLKGPWIAGAYYNEPERSAESMVDGWLRTGDIATIDEEGFVQIMDRTKDLVKSGGEWISSVDLENTIMAHPAVAEAAVIAIPDVKWQERPLACVLLKPDYKGKVEAGEILDFLKDKVARWWIPDRVEFVDEIPKTSVGKFNKRVLREKFWK
ncbi:MAG: long-chain fatty acid--CoA ligase [Peptococcaceae bacterium]|nr:long-chain fatty acid--CoA ligase [Peptococcaceae bacterium]